MCVHVCEYIKLEVSISLIDKLQINIISLQNILIVIYIFSKEKDSIQIQKMAQMRNILGIIFMILISAATIILGMPTVI